jgi:Peptidase S8 pro-domain
MPVAMWPTVRRVVQVGTMLLAVICMSSCDHYTNQWAVRVEGGEDVARQLAADHGFVFVSKVRIVLFLGRYFGTSSEICSTNVGRIETLTA